MARDKYQFSIWFLLGNIIAIIIWFIAILLVVYLLIVPIPELKIGLINRIFESIPILFILYFMLWCAKAAFTRVPIHIYKINDDFFFRFYFHSEKVNLDCIENIKNNSFLEYYTIYYRNSRGAIRSVFIYFSLRGSHDLIYYMKSHASSIDQSQIQIRKNDQAQIQTRTFCLHPLAKLLHVMFQILFVFSGMLFSYGIAIDYGAGWVDGAAIFCLVFVVFLCFVVIEARYFVTKLTVGDDTILIESPLDEAEYFKKDIKEIKQIVNGFVCIIVRDTRNKVKIYTVWPQMENIDILIRELKAAIK